MDNWTWKQHKMWFRRGIRNGIPICLGYFAVSLTLGITARNAGLTPGQATLTSLLINASAGEFIGFTLMAANAGYLEVLVMEAVANARYLLMSCALSQRVHPSASLWQRALMGFYVTDEIFGVSIASPEEKIDPFYNYGMAAIASPGWGLGTCLGVILGNILPASVVSALSVGLYGMFVAVIIPPAKKNRLIAGLIAVSFVASYLMSVVPLFDGLSSGVQVILLTVLISLGAAILFPVREEEKRHDA